MKSLKASLYLIIALLTVINCSSTKLDATSEVAPKLNKIELSVQVQNELYQFLKTGSVWSGTKKVGSSSENNTAEIFTIEPTQGWEEFELILDHFEILELPNQVDTKGNLSTKLSSISQKYYFTINNNGVARSYEYINPEANLLNSWEAQSVVSFGTYLTNEFTQTPQSN